MGIWRCNSLLSLWLLFGLASASSLRPSRSLQTNAERKVFMYADYIFTDWGNICTDFKYMVDGGVTHVILAFYLNSGPADAVQAWTAMSASDRSDCLEYLHGKGSRLIMSSGGATEMPTSYDAVDYATGAAQTALSYDFDGMDFDIEGLSAGFGDDPVVYNWLLTASLTARKVFDDAGRPEMTISHAPQGPYFTTSFAGSNKGYVQLMRDAGDAIDYYLVQYYNQDTCAYANYDSIFIASEAGCWSPGAAWSEIVASLGSDSALAQKIALGKPATTQDVYNTGYITPSSIGSIACEAETNLNWTGGVMLWVYRGPDGINAVLPPIATSMCGDGSGEVVPPVNVPAVTSPVVVATTAAPSAGATVAGADLTCYRNSAGFWWSNTCDVSSICIADPSITDEATCLNTDLPYPEYVATRQDCITAVNKSGGCSTL